MTRRKLRPDSLKQMLEAAPPDVLRKLLHRLADDAPEVRSACYDFLKDKVALLPQLQRNTPGEREKYLALRLGLMNLGDDYHDLATWYWEAGEKDKALSTAETGLKLGGGRLDGLRTFLAERALEGGDRPRFLELRFQQAVDPISLESWQQFKKVCSTAEWKIIEKRLLDLLPKAGRSARLQIRMHRMEFDLAIALLLKEFPCGSAWDSSEELQAANRLEALYPEEVLRFHLATLGNLDVNAPRKEYAAKAQLLLRVRHVLRDVIRDESRWIAFASRIKRANQRRPAFLEEFARAVPDWGIIPG